MGGLISSFIEPFLLMAQKKIYSVAPSQIPNINALSQEWIRGFYSDGRARQLALENGFNDEHMQAFYELALQRLDLTDINRYGLLTNNLDEVYNEHYQVAGYNPALKDIYKQLMKTQPTIAEAVELRARGAISEERYIEICKYANMPPEIAAEMYNLARPLLTAYDIITVWRRGQITEYERNERIQQLGYKEEDINNLVLLSEYYPSPSDLVTFAVREVYSPEIVEKYGLNEDFPSEFLQAAFMSGLSETFARQYWAAHWRLPSATQGFEMLHRGIITHEELTTLLRALDYMPFWRDKLIQVAYNPYTRVDIRRMYAMGILDRDGVYRSYLDIGYDAEHAENLTRFTLGLEAPDVKEMSKGEILRAYKLGTLSRDDSIQRLERLEYVRTEAEILLDTAELEQRNSAVSRAINNLVSQYEADLINESELSAALDALGISYTRRDQAILEATTSKVTKVKTPTKAELTQMYKKGIINAAEYRSNLELLGYDSVTIERFILLYSSSMNGSTEPSA